MSWAQVAAATGRQAHPRMQWHALVGSPDPATMHGSLWHGDNPPRGHLPSPALAALCDILAGHTATPATCWFCLWEGYGWLHDPEDPPTVVSPEQLRGPRVSHPGRDYLLFTGPVHAALTMGHAYGPDWFMAQSPNLFWPQDRAWCVASEIDFDSTLVAGSHALIDALLQTPDLGSWPLAPDDSLAADADQINHIP